MKHRLFWTAEKVASRIALIRPLIQRRREPIPPFRYLALDRVAAEADLFSDFDDCECTIVEPGTYWGGWNINFVLESSLRVPSDWNDGPVALYLPLGEAGDIFNHPEALLYVDGRPLASADRYHHVIRLPDSLRDGRPHALRLLGWTGLSGWPPDPTAQTKLFMKECAVVQIDTATEAFVTLAQLALDVANELANERPEKHRILNALDAALLSIDTRDPLGADAFYATVPAALATLRTQLAEAGPPMDVDIVAVGHAHMDIAYLWQVAQTRRKCGRTYSNVLRLMEAFPDYRFSQDQPQLYKYTEEDYPEIFKAIRDRVADGQWEVMGGMWVEADCNVSGGEALVRQLLLGRSYFRKKFGDAETPVLWLPDTFGFCWSLPQLMKQAGLKWFVTNKVNWSQYNPMPAQITWWQGLDGTRVLAHFLTTPSVVQHLPFPTTYKAEMTAGEVFGSWRNFRQKETHNELLMAYGYGDGGGGPTEQLIANANALGRMPGTPRVRMGTVRSFFEGIERAGTEQLPVWADELYSEGHRGVLTSQARIKRSNRKCEALLHDAEFLAALASVKGKYDYPMQVFARAWELLCLNQFHDILPGTSLPEVFEDTLRDHAKIKSAAKGVLEDSMAAIAKTMRPETAIIAINPSPFPGMQVGLLETENVPGFLDLTTGEPLMIQPVEQGTLIELPEQTAYSVIAIGKGVVATTHRSTLMAENVAGQIVLENDLVRVHINPFGQVASVFDKEAEREVIASGTVGNELQAFEDRPLNWDAWDIDAFFEDRKDVVANAERLEVVESGPVRASVLIESTYRSSRITQRICLYNNTKRIDFATEVDWHETHTLLKVAFPVSVHSPTATYDIQWGNIQRPTHRNTSWDFAKFEVPAQKWADLSEGNYGVAILNDCKYGYDIRDNVIRLSLIKSATMPDPNADQGMHRFTYSLLPHTGDWRNGVPSAAYGLNDPVILQPVRGAQGNASALRFVATEKPNAVIETIKQAEDGNGMIVRLYEAERKRGPARLTFGFDVTAVRLCNLLEEDQEELVINDNRVALDLGPYELVSLRCIPA